MGVHLLMVQQLRLGWMALTLPRRQALLLLLCNIASAL